MSKFLREDILELFTALAAGPSEGDVQTLLHLVLGARQVWVQARLGGQVPCPSTALAAECLVGLQVSFTGFAWS